MKLKKQSKTIKALSFVLTLTICLGGAFTGAYAAAPDQLQRKTFGQDAVSEEAEDIVFNLASNGQNRIIQSGSFEVIDNQTLTITVQSDIKGGSVALTLFSPEYKEQRITLSDFNETKTIEISTGRWAYNCTGFFKSGDITIIGTAPNCDNTGSPDKMGIETRNNAAAAINLENAGQNCIVQSGSFEAKDNQVLTLSIQSDIKNGSVDLFLFSPDHKEQRITISGSDDTKTIALSAGRWAYNCTGFFKSGNIKIVGEIK